MKCPKCKSKETEIRTEGRSTDLRENYVEKIEFDIWRCRDCGELWKKEFIFQ